jgi:hypothetical protein
MFTTDLQIRRRGRKSTLRPYPLVPNLFDKVEPNMDDIVKLKRSEQLAVEILAGPEGAWLVVPVPAEDAFDFVQRVGGEYAKIKDGDHKSVRRVLRRAYLAALKMQREPDEFERLQADPFWNTSLHKPKDASTSKWVVHFIMQVRTPNLRSLAGKYVAILDRLLRDEVSPDDKRIAKMEGVEAAHEAVQARQRIRGLKSWSRRQGGNG